MTSTLTLAPAAITRRLHSNGLSYVHSHTLHPGVVRVWLIEDDATVDAAKRTARAVLMQAGYEVASASGYENALLVTLPEPTEPEQPLDEVEARADAEHAAGLVHLMSDALLDACGTAAPGGLHLAPSTTPERITCPACRILAAEEPATVERYRTPSGNRDEDRFRAVHSACGWRSPAWHSNRTIEGRSLAERDAREHRCPVVEADVPPTAEERVTVPIRARELRAGDEVVDSLGARQYAAFDTDAGTHIADGRLVRVWTAIRDQEAGLPPVITVPADRELLVLRPVSEEGRELLATLDRSPASTPPAFGSPAWALSLLPENRRS